MQNCMFLNFSLTTIEIQKYGILLQNYILGMSTDFHYIIIFLGMADHNYVKKDPQNLPRGGARHFFCMKTILCAVAARKEIGT